MDYTFGLMMKNRTENEILKDLVIDLNKKCNKFENECENLRKENKMARQCIKLNEKTICQLQKQVVTLEDALGNMKQECGIAIKNALEKYASPNNIWYWQSLVYLSQNQFNGSNGFCGAIIWENTIDHQQNMKNI